MSGLTNLLIPIILAYARIIGIKMWRGLDGGVYFTYPIFTGHRVSSKDGVKMG